MWKEISISLVISLLYCCNSLVNSAQVNVDLYDKPWLQGYLGKVTLDTTQPNGGCKNLDAKYIKSGVSSIGFTAHNGVHCVQFHPDWNCKGGAATARSNSATLPDFLDNKEYLFANSSMSPIPVAFSLMVSYMSAISLLGTTSEYYLNGSQFIMINLGNIMVAPIVVYVFLPVFHELKTTSVYEYLNLRFGPTIRTLASLAFSLQMVLYMGIVLYAPCLAISAVTGLSTWAGVLSAGLVCIFYSTVGGIKAVLLTDVFQGSLMFIATYCVIIKGAIDSGGIDNVLRIASDGGRLDFPTLFDLDPTERHTLFSMAIGGGFVFLTTNAVNQAQIQRLLTTRSLKSAKFSFWFSLVILTFLSMSNGFAGLVVYSKYHRCDPLLQGRICSADQLLPLFVADSFQNIPGMTGLFIAGLLSGSLSTISSLINSLAAISWEDYMKPFIKKPPSQWAATAATKTLTFLYGIACIGVAFIAANFHSILNAAFIVFGIVGGPLLALFTLGMMFPFVSETATIPSFIVALAVGLWIGFGGPKPPIGRLSGDLTGCSESDFPGGGSSSSCSANSTSSYDTGLGEKEYFYMYRISYLWYTLIGFSITVLLSCLISLRFPEKRRIPKSLLSPIIHRIIREKYDRNECDTQMSDGDERRKPEESSSQKAPQPPALAVSRDHKT